MGDQPADPVDQLPIKPKCRQHFFSDRRSLDLLMFTGRTAVLFQRRFDSDIMRQRSGRQHHHSFFVQPFHFSDCPGIGGNLEKVVDAVGAARLIVNHLHRQQGEFVHNQRVLSDMTGWGRPVGNSPMQLFSLL